MRKSRFSEERIIGVLREQESGATTAGRPLPSRRWSRYEQPGLSLPLRDRRGAGHSRSKASSDIAPRVSDCGRNARALTRALIAIKLQSGARTTCGPDALVVEPAASSVRVGQTYIAASDGSQVLAEGAPRGPSASLMSRPRAQPWTRREEADSRHGRAEATGDRESGLTWCGTRCRRRALAHSLRVPTQLEPRIARAVSPSARRVLAEHREGRCSFTIQRSRSRLCEML